MNEKNHPRVSRSKGKAAAHEGCSKGNGPTNKRFTTVDDGGGDMIECSGKYCKSCTAGLIADCVALCCCPCAVLHCFALAFVKAPWVVGRRCLGLGKKNKKKVGSNKRNCKRGHELDDVSGGVDVVLEKNKEDNLKVGWPDSSSAPIENVTVNAGFEAEKVWLELYQIGHLDFGRVSFSGD